MVLEKTLESPLDCKEIKPVNPKGNQPWIFTGRTDAEAEAPVFWPSDMESWLFRKAPDAGEDWRQEEKRAAENEMTRQRHQLSGHESEQTPGEWRTGKPGVLQSMVVQRAGHDLATEQQWCLTSASQVTLGPVNSWRSYTCACVDHKLKSSFDHGKCSQSRMCRMHLVYSESSLGLEMSAETRGKKDTLLELNAPATFLLCRGCLTSFNSELCNNPGRQTNGLQHARLPCPSLSPL